MHKPARLYTGLGVAVLVLLCSLPASAQIEDQISAYTGENATGYLQPLTDAFGANLNDGLFRSAHISRIGFHIQLEVRVMAVIFGDEDKTFRATAEGDFEPLDGDPSTLAPTIVGSGKATIMEGMGGTNFAFPGGFDLHSFAIAAPQLRIGSVFGTEALIRYFALDVSDSELGNLSLFGFGLRHSISQYLGPTFPVDIAGGFFWQKFSVGEDLIDSSAFSFGVQASKRLGGGIVYFEPYTGLSIDRFSMNVSYESEVEGEEEGQKELIDVDFDPTTTAHFTLGLGVNLAFANIHGEINIANMFGFSFGIAFGM
ncbi:MAG: hypothetical protein JSV33_12625 [bacterium]|nr:MAG: hypothetical protein JSV33_12625 [bacterium]